VKSIFLHAIRNVRPGSTLLAVLSFTLLCTSAAKAATIPITSNACGYYITAPGDYTLETDIGPCEDANGLYIFASDVTLHLNGHTISSTCGAAGWGIFVYGAAGPLTGVHVVGPGTLKDWEIGVAAFTTSNSSVSLLKVTANCSTFTEGFYLDSTLSQWTLLGNVIEGPGDNQSWGIFSVASGNTIVGNSVNDSMVFSEGSSNNYIAGNILSDTLVLYYASNNVVFGNFVSNSVGSGIYDYAGSNNQILANTTDNNKGPGIQLTGGTTGELVTLNQSLNNTPWDMEDDNPACGTDNWQRNTFKTANQTCIH